MDFLYYRKMRDQNPEIIDFLEKIGAVGTWILIGLAGKFGLDMVSGKKFTIWYVLGTSCTAIFAGYLTYEWCLSHPSMPPGIIIPIATLASRDIALFFAMIDYAGVLKLITRKGTKESNKDE